LLKGSSSGRKRTEVREEQFERPLIGGRTLIKPNKKRGEAWHPGRKGNGRFREQESEGGDQDEYRGQARKLRTGEHRKLCFCCLFGEMTLRLGGKAKKTKGGGKERKRLKGTSSKGKQEKKKHPVSSFSHAHAVRKRDTHQEDKKQKNLQQKTRSKEVTGSLGWKEETLPTCEKYKELFHRPRIEKHKQRRKNSRNGAKKRIFEKQIDQKRERGSRPGGNAR